MLHFLQVLIEMQTETLAYYVFLSLWRGENERLAKVRPIFISESQLREVPVISWPGLLYSTDSNQFS